MILLAWAFAVSMQMADYAGGMYCGGNQVVYMGTWRAARVAGTVVMTDDAEIPRARVQRQVPGSSDILREIEADDKGRFRFAATSGRALLVGSLARRFQPSLLGLDDRTSRRQEEAESGVEPGYLKPHSQGHRLPHRHRFQLAAADNAVDQPVFERLVGLQNIVAIHVAGDFFARLARSLGKDLIQRFTHPPHLTPDTINVGGLSAQAAH